MLIVRPAGPADFGSLMELAVLSGRGFTSLPEDEPTLRSRLDLSQASFEANVAAPEAWYTLMLEDADRAFVDWVEAAYVAGEMGRPHLDRAEGRLLRNISSIAFGGPYCATAYLGCLLDRRLPVFDAPVRGHPPAHWSRRPTIFD